MAIIVHAVQKLLNISRLKPALFISGPSEGQELHSWYAKLVSTSFPGKLMVMYIHEPSLLMVLVKGKTIKGTINEFYTRLHAHLTRNSFERAFILREMEHAKDGYIISKTNSKSILGSMNEFTWNIEVACSNILRYEDIDLNRLEDYHMEWLIREPGKPNKYKEIKQYWMDKGVIRL